jgi:hypothetical protein
LHLEVAMKGIITDPDKPQLVVPVLGKGEKGN